MHAKQQQLLGYLNVLELVLFCSIQKVKRFMMQRQKYELNKTLSLNVICILSKCKLTTGIIVKIHAYRHLICFHLCNSAIRTKRYGVHLYNDDQICQMMYSHVLIDTLHTISLIIAKKFTVENENRSFIVSKLRILVLKFTLQVHI